MSHFLLQFSVALWLSSSQWNISGIDVSHSIPAIRIASIQFSTLFLSLSRLDTNEQGDLRRQGLKMTEQSDKKNLGNGVISGGEQPTEGQIKTLFLDFKEIKENFSVIY